MNRKRMILYIVSAAFLLGGCAQAEVPPALVEPVSVNQAYRPVEKRLVGKAVYEVGNVVPTEYSYYFRKNTVLKEICCDVGSYVEEGDILAKADVEKLEEERQDLAGEREKCVRLHDARQPLYALNEDLIDIDRQSHVNLEDYKGAAECENRLNMEKENHVYDEQLHAYMLEQYGRKIAQIDEDIAEASLKATKSGYVTYIKDTSKSNVARINEAVVNIADDKDLYIEVPDLNLDNYLYRNYEKKLALIGGREVPVEEYDYTGDESVYALAQQTYPNIRFKTKEPVTLSVGDTIVLCFYNKERQEELCVGNDSVNSDDAGSYVYVKGADGEQEKRYFTAGPSDEYYTTVIDGLKEGEEVLYVQEAASPAKYREYTVERTDYVQSLETSTIRKAETLNTAYFAPCSGTVEEVRVAAGDPVKEGDVMVVIDSGGGSAAIRDLENERKRVLSEYEKEINSLDQKAYDLTAQIKVTTLETANYHLCEPEYRFQTARMKDEAKIAVIEKQLAQIEYESDTQKYNRELGRIRKNNDGTGRISIVAQNDGVVSKVYAKKGMIIKRGEENDLLLSCSRISPDKLELSLGKTVALQIAGKNLQAAGIGTTMRLQGPDERTCDGICISNAWNGRSIAFTEEEKARVTVVNTDDKDSGSIVVMLESPDFLEQVDLKDCRASVDTLKLKDAIVLPGSLVYTEESKSTKSEKSFVWKIINGRPVKQYIIKGTEYGIGNDQTTVVLSGVTQGDVLADEHGQT